MKSSNGRCILDYFNHGNSKGKEFHPPRREYPSSEAHSGSIQGADCRGEYVQDGVLRSAIFE